MARALTITFLFVLLTFSQVFAAGKNQSVYDRVMETGTIRCGYLPYEPFIIKDPVTDELSGVTYDYINGVAEELGLEVDWAGEVNIDQVVPALEAGRFDMFWLPCSPDENWQRVLDFSADVGALPYFIYVARDSDITSEELQTARFVTIDGYALTGITKEEFPEAGYISMPQTTSPAELYDQIRYGKADAHINEHISAKNYMRNNPGVIRRFSDEPLIAMKMYLPVKKGDKKMRGFAEENFSANEGRNLALMREIMEERGLERDILLLGEDCGETVVTEQTWRVCGAVSNAGTD
jgi:ABC-type amino acid transport substrate-binding protein